MQPLFRNKAARVFRRTALLALAFAAWPAFAQQPEPLSNTQPFKTPVNPREPIITDKEFEEAIPSLDAQGPMESIEEWQKQQEENEKIEAEQQAKDPDLPAFQDQDIDEALPDPPVNDPEIDDPLPSIDSFDAEPPPAFTEADDSISQKVPYLYEIVGLEDKSGAHSAVFESITDRFDDLSALDSGNGTADNGAQISSGLREDRQLLLDLLQGEGFYDATVEAAADPPSVSGQPVSARLTTIPGPRYALGSIAFQAAPVTPPDLITSNFVPKTGDPIVAERILTAEANIALALPQNGYPFAKVGQRDILLDEDVLTGDYTLPVNTGARAYFGAIRSEGNGAFKADHIEILRRFDKGELYDARKLDDLRAAMIATGLFSSVAVEPVLSSERAPDGTAYADLLVRQEAGPPRTIAASAGYSTGQGFRAEGSWTHRNMFPPEGALTLSAVAGTQEQGVGTTFRRSNAGKRDRTVELTLSALHSEYSAFDAYTGTLAGRISYDSTPIWQKKFTYGFGFEIVGSSEEDYDFTLQSRERRTYYVLALPVQAGFDTSNDLLNPTKGFRVNLKASPETSLGSGAQVYARTLVEATGYYPVADNIVLAGRARVGSIAGVSRESLVPSRRYYGGGGGSVRGFGHQQLGPRDPNGDPVGGRSLVEAAAEVRYRFGNFGVVGFVDAGQVYESSIPQFNNWRFGVGIGGRFYTNFGPFRLDIATPINRQPGESLVSVYVSIGQAF